MISSIGFLPSGVSIERLKKFVADKEIASSLSHLNIPIVDAPEEPYDDDESEEEIMENDIVVFCTPNESDMSFIQVHIQNKECTNMFLHHDVYVFSTIIDSSCMTIDGSPYVALGTFESDVMVFDPLVKNPMIPQILLRGHEDAVLSLTCHDGVLFSGSSDSCIIEWDMEKMCSKTRVEVNGPVDKISVSHSSVVYSSGNSLYYHDQKIDFEGDVERIRVEGDRMYVCDGTGTLRCYDSRNMSNVVNESKIHDDSITGLDILGNDIYTCSLDETIKVMDINTFNIKNVKNTGERLFSLRINAGGFYVYGGESNELMMSYVDE